ncbi:hypothetical protein Acor_03770 [Acrocarpospora corrugata]|uniref:Uncharacterized protein n=1 Tax=Acrocarpospora corrugata TaxID=35763 RepID=A0A5M3VNT2_9ACTN|nr:hypothetical protein [Acrocarpospora corrugata]GER98315.1 hypothetical protein Acor_03770 [Acrocarpospora corrugata]
MAFRLIGGPSGNQGSPTLYEEGDDYLVQGYLLTPQELASLSVPDGETVVRVPKGLMTFLLKET